MSLFVISKLQLINGLFYTNEIKFLLNRGGRVVKWLLMYYFASLFNFWMGDRIGTLGAVGIYFLFLYFLKIDLNI